MAKRYIETVVKLDGEAEYKKALSNINGELKTLGSESKLIQAEFKGQANSMEALEAKGDNLRKKLKEQSEAVEILEEALSKSRDAYGDHAKETQAWQQKLNRAKASLIDLEGELKDNDKYLDEARKSTDKCAKSIDGFGKEVKDAEGDINSFGGVISSLIGGDGGKGLAGMKSMLAKGFTAAAIVKGLKETSEAVMEVVDSTKEYRTVMGSLEVSSGKAGYTAEQTEEAYMRLYAALGDNQTAATATANLQALGLEQEQLMILVDATIGAWSTYGDSIPIDGLAEAVNETIRCGEVTGVFADVLNWGSKEGETFGVTMKESTKENEEWNKKVAECKTAEDYFNLALSECSTQAERQDLMMRALAEGGLAEAGREWRTVNEDVVKNNESLARYESAMGRLGEVLSPVADFLRNVRAASIEWVADRLEKAIEVIGRFIRKVGELARASTTATSKAEDAGYNGSHAGGLARVPFDNYRAILHKDEMVLPAEESETLRRWFSGSMSAFTETRAVSRAGGRENGLDGQLQPITTVVEVVLDGDKVARSVTTRQAELRRAGGLA